ncbi:MAG: extracellular catalytic domain type 1 short-chain-length polyhydroxyalkanoate depolymerase [Bacteroidia bacterium]
MKKLLLVCFALFAAKILAACSCIGQQSVQEGYKNAAIVFSGKVVSDSLVKSNLFGNDRSYTQKRYKFSVTRVYKGANRSVAVVETGLGGGDCGIEFQINTEYIVYARLQNDSLKIFATDIYSRTKEFSITEELALLKLSRKNEKLVLYKQKEFGSNPGSLLMNFYVPDSLKQNKLVVVLHGCSQTARSCAEQTGWNDLANKHGFALLYPEQQIINNISNCFNWFNTDDQDTISGEAASIKNMILWMKQRYNLDTVCITGLSAGAAMANTVMINFPELINKGALFAGGPFGAAKNLNDAGKAMAGKITKTPDEWAALARAARPGYTGSYPQVAIFQGEADYTVDKRNAIELVKQWTALHGVDTTTTAVERLSINNPRITESVYGNSASGQVVLLFMITKLGHALPVDPNGKTARGGKTGIFATDIDFHSTAWVAEWFGVLH